MALRQTARTKTDTKTIALQMQVIKLVELNTVELEDKIKQELEENPALEAGDEEMPQDPDDSDITLDNEDESENVSQEDIILGDYASEEDIPDYRINGTPDYDPYYRQTNYSDEKSLIESLEEQIALQNLDERKQKIAQYIIGNLDENGYLQRDLKSISDDLLFHEHIDVSSLEMEDVLYEIQDLDPPAWAPVICRSAYCCNFSASCLHILPNWPYKFLQSTSRSFRASIMTKFSIN
jgi:RNA polymerase sigma-54 factor